MTKRPGRPANPDGHIYRTIDVSGTPAEISSLLDILTPRERLEAMLAAIQPAQGKE